MTSQTFFFILLGVIVIALFLGIRYMARHDRAAQGRKTKRN